MKKLCITVVIIYSLMINVCYSNSDNNLKNRVKLSIPSEFIFEAYPNQPLIPIRLLGAVKNAGLYHVPSNIKLTTLLSLAGGTTSEADLEKIIIGNDSIENRESKNINLEEVIKYGGISQQSLQAHDVILVNNKSPLISNDSFRVISVVSVILTSLLTAVLIKDKLDEK